MARPIDRKKQRTGIAEKIIFLLFIDFSDVAYQGILELRFAFIPWTQGILGQPLSPAVPCSQTGLTNL